MKKKSIILIILLIIGGIGGIYAYYFYFVINWDDQLPPNYDKLDRIEFNVSGAIIDDFAYWLQDIDVEKAKNSPYDLLIIDYSSDGEEAGEFSYAQVEYMKSSEANKKLLLSYISIGEAETYRFYWNNTWDADFDGTPDASAPEWLDIENPEWEGNYKVHFWEQGWQNITYEYLDRILAAGFDGIYMDIIDAYEYYEGSVSHSDWLMMDFVANISNYVKAEAGANFSVFVQNADELLVNSSYLSVIDGIGREDLFFDDNDQTDKEWRAEGINNLNRAVEGGKAVLVTDYPENTDDVYSFYSKCIDNEYLAYGAERDLDSLKSYEFYPPT